MQRIDRSDALAKLAKYQKDRPENMATWLKWAAGILRNAADLKPGDEGLKVTSPMLISILNKGVREIFRLLMEEDVKEWVTNNQVVLARGYNPSNIVTRILLCRGDEFTVDFLVECGLAGLDEEEPDRAALDRLCEKLNAVWFRPWVDLSPELEMLLRSDMVKALKELGEKVSFKEALGTATRSGEYSEVAGLMDRLSTNSSEDGDGSDSDVEPDAEDESGVPVPPAA
jgi:hypothetical protein